MATSPNTTRPPSAILAILAAAVIGTAPIIAVLLTSATQVGK